MRQRRKINRKLNTQMRKKLVILFGMVLLALVGLILKISVINATEGDKYSKQVLMQTQQQDVYKRQVLALGYWVLLFYVF